jgi:hypothetical protein
LLLDAFILVLVLYRAGAPPDLPFPPPQNSALWRAITDIKRVGVMRWEGMVWSIWCSQSGDASIDGVCPKALSCPKAMTGAPITQVLSMFLCIVRHLLAVYLQWLLMYQRPVLFSPPLLLFLLQHVPFAGAAGDNTH